MEVLEDSNEGNKPRDPVMEVPEELGVGNKHRGPVMEALYDPD